MIQAGVVTKATKGFSCAEAASATTLDNSAAYLQGWRLALKGDAHIILKGLAAHNAPPAPFSWKTRRSVLLFGNPLLNGQYIRRGSQDFLQETLGLRVRGVQPQHDMHNLSDREHDLIDILR